MYEPLGGGAAAVTDAVLAAATAGATTHVAIEGKEGGVALDVLKAVIVQTASLEFGRLVVNDLKPEPILPSHMSTCPPLMSIGRNVPGKAASHLSSPIDILSIGIP